MALAIGLALISFMSVLSASVKASMAAGYRETITADYVIESSRDEMLGGLPPAVAERVATLPQVAVASRLRFGHWKDGQTTSALTAVDPRTLPSVTGVKLVQGRLDALADGGVTLAEHIVRERHLRVGDQLEMTFARTGRQHLPIVGVLRDRDADGLSTGYLISLATFGQHFSENVDASLFVRLADGVDMAAGRTALTDALKGYPTVAVKDEGTAVEGRLQAVDQVLGLVTVLLLMTVVVATLGIANTLALSMLERTREIGLLRAVGMTRRQLRAMVRGEAARGRARRRSGRRGGHRAGGRRGEGARRLDDVPGVPPWTARRRRRPGDRHRTRRRRRPGEAGRAARRPAGDHRRLTQTSPRATIKEGWGSWVPMIPNPP